MRLFLFVSVFLISYFSGYVEARSEEARQYLPINYENLSKTYWFLSMHDLNNKEAVDGFARIHFCDVYTAYYQDDFQWERIRHSIREEISREKSGYPYHYFLIAPIYLDRYDFSTQGFSLLDKSALFQVNTLRALSRSDYKGHCGSGTRATKDYPNRVTLKFKEPLSLEKIPMAQVKANDLLKRMNNAGNKDRILFMKVLLRISGFQNRWAKPTTSNVDLRATVEALEIYEDIDTTELLYKTEINAN